MTALTDLQQSVHEAQAYAREAREYNRLAHARMILTRQEVERAYLWALTACVAPWMPTANALTQEITATILANHSLLDKRPAGRRTAGRDDDR